MKTAKLGDVCKLIKGKKPSEFTSDGEEYLTAKTIRNQEPPRYVNRGDKSSILIKPTDLIIIMDGSNSGELFTGLDGVLSSTMGLIRHQAFLDSRYLLYFLTTHRENFSNNRTGSAIPHLNKEQFMNLEVFIPSLEEQRRIVARLDAAFEKIDRAIELTGKNTKSSWLLFNSLRTKKITGPAKYRFGDIMTLQRGFDLPKRLRKQGEYPLISSSGVIDSIHEHKVTGPSICTGRSGSIGSTFYVEGPFWPLNTTLYVKDFHGNDPRYCYWVLHGLDLKQFAGGTGVPTLNRNIVHEHEISILPETQQKQAAKEIDEAFLSCQRLDSQYREKINDLKSMKQSLLTQAFSQNKVQ